MFEDNLRMSVSDLMRMGTTMGGLRVGPDPGPVARSQFASSAIGLIEIRKRREEQREFLASLYSFKPTREKE